MENSFLTHTRHNCKVIIHKWLCYGRQAGLDDETNPSYERRTWLLKVSLSYSSKDFKDSYDKIRTDIPIRWTGISLSHNETFSVPPLRSTPTQSLLYLLLQGSYFDFPENWLSNGLLSFQCGRKNSSSGSQKPQCPLYTVQSFSTNTFENPKWDRAHNRICPGFKKGSDPEYRGGFFFLNRCKRLIQSTPSNTKDSPINNSVPSNLIRDLARIPLANLNQDLPKDIQI